jgi:hypothetical protein
MPHDESRLRARRIGRQWPFFPILEITMNHHVNATLLGGALLLGAASVSAIDFPSMKPGLWESTMSREGAPQKLAGTKMCMDAAVQKEMMEMGMGTMKTMCSKNDIRRDGNKVYGNAECKFGESTMKSTSVTTFTGDTAYHTEVKSTYEPPMQGMAAGTAVIDARWTGACPAGMQVGDVTLPDGRKINMRTMAGGAQAAPAPPAKK